MERRTTLREEDQVILAPPLISSTWPKTATTSTLASATTTSAGAVISRSSSGFIPFPQAHSYQKASNNLIPLEGRAGRGASSSSSSNDSPKTGRNSGTDTPPLPLEEEYSLDFVFACLGSSKQHRYLFDLRARNLENEDRIFLGKVKLPTRSDSDSEDEAEALFIGLYDGHGGAGKASSFVCERLKTTFETMLEKNCSLLLTMPEKISQALEESFRLVDVEFHKTVKSEAEKANVTKKQPAAKGCCKYFNEDPCACLNPPISANEGSTGTVVIVTKSHIICANVGDSDAFIAERVNHDSPDDDQDESSASPSSTGSTSTSIASLDDEMPLLKRSRLANAFPASSFSSSQVVLTQLTITDTPIPDELNEDYQRIRNIAQRAASNKASISVGTAQVYNEKLPKDGILRNSRGDRFNYVAVPGARSLNMVRAFGNLGNKRFVDDTILESESPIISRPHLKIVPRTNRICAIVIGSDGLWDNVDKAEVALVMGKHLLSEGSSKQCAKDLLTRAINARKKPDDVSVVIVPL
jgi:serine/threonine protein phosphatase PrpC